MDFPQAVMRYDEKIVMSLRSLYSIHGYSQYRMSRFEEYELYAENKAFLASGDIITFTGASGKLMALRPDVTLSIVKHANDDNLLKKLYYNENVYRPENGEFKEQMQVGLECIGEIDPVLTAEVLTLAKQSLKLLCEHTRLDISHIGFLSGLLESEDLSTSQKSEFLYRAGEKNVAETYALCKKYGIDNRFADRLTVLMSLYGSYDNTIETLKSISINETTKSAVEELESVFSILKEAGIDDDVNLDFTIVNDLNYYSGIIFQGYIEGIPKKVLSGGRYDELLRKFAMKSGAIGFAVNLDLLEYINTDSEDIGTEILTTSDNMINIALPKGRLGDEVYAVFEKAGYGCPAILEESRKLFFENPENNVRYFWVKPSDVAVYVERGAADIGVVGKDILLEGSFDVYELVDLALGKCRMCVAAAAGFVENTNRTLRVATKFPNIARNYYAKSGREIDIIYLNGSIELAPLLGLSDVIVDIVETGKTLAENNLEVKDTITDISAGLISNKASYKFKHDAISELCRRLSDSL